MQKSNQERQILVNPPAVRIKAERPKKRRIKVAWENKIQKRCENFQQFRDNKKTCKNQSKRNI